MARFFAVYYSISCSKPGPVCFLHWLSLLTSLCSIHLTSYYGCHGYFIGTVERSVFFVQTQFGGWFYFGFENLERLSLCVFFFCNRQQLVKAWMDPRPGTDRGTDPPAALLCSPLYRLTGYRWRATLEMIHDEGFLLNQPASQALSATTLVFLVQSIICFFHCFLPTHWKKILQHYNWNAEWMNSVTPKICRVIHTNAYQMCCFGQKKSKMARRKCMFCIVKMFWTCLFCQTAVFSFNALSLSVSENKTQLSSSTYIKERKQPHWWHKPTGGHVDFMLISFTVRLFHPNAPKSCHLWGTWTLRYGKMMFFIRTGIVLTYEYCY